MSEPVAERGFAWRSRAERAPRAAICGCSVGRQTLGHVRSFSLMLWPGCHII
ncbi:MAG: hypothetical protein M0Q92_15265 [Methanoregula sp.]|nr:hypothetical protein [Methanoregula sp.]